MKLSGGRLFSILALVSMLQSCSTVMKTPKALYIHHFSVQDESGSSRILNSDYLFYDSNSSWVDDKTIYRTKDSIIEDISISLGNSEPSFHSFSASRYFIQKNPDQFPTFKQPGVPDNVYVRNNQDTSQTNIELLGFSYLYIDTVQKRSYLFEYESEGGYISMNEVSISHESDSISYDRILALSPEIIDFFRQEIIKMGDSIELTTIPAMPDLSNCTLKESRYSIFQNISNPYGNKRGIYIDSVLVEGKYDVSQKEEIYFLFEENDPVKGYKLKRYKANHYLERHFLPNEVSPYYELIYDLSPDGIDTTFKSELTVSKDGRLYCYKIIQQGHFSQMSGPKDLRRPIVKREMYFWINPRKSSIVRKRYVAYTDQNHQLEKEWITSNNYKIITILDTIPEISGTQKYDLVPLVAHEPIYPYFNSLSNKKHKSPRKSPHYQNRQMIKHLRKRTIELEKDRKTGYEKRITSDSLEIYEIFYFEKRKN